MNESQKVAYIKLLVDNHEHVTEQGVLKAILLLSLGNTEGTTENCMCPAGKSKELLMHSESQNYYLFSAGRNLFYQRRITMKKSAISFAWLFVVILLFSGCALTKETVSISYDPQKNVSKLEGADSVSVKVEVADVRTMKDKVSCKKNAYGMEMAAIVAENDVAKTLEQAIEAELISRGFSSGSSVLIFTELQKFYNDFKVGFWSGTAIAEVTMNIQIKQKDGSIIFSKVVSAEGTNPGVMLASGENAKIALNDALKNSVAKLFGDKTFFDAIFAAAKNNEKNTTSK